MLMTPSPAPTSSASTSPVLIRHAHGRTHAHAHAHVLSNGLHGRAPIPRRRPTSQPVPQPACASMASPASPRSRRNPMIGAEAAAEGPAAAAAVASATIAATNQSPSRRNPADILPQPQSQSEPQPRQQSMAVASTAPKSTQGGPNLAAAKPDHQAALSPNKRRGSPAPSATLHDPSGLPDEEAKTTKRPKAEDSPPKTLPSKYEFCPMEDVVELVASMLNELIATNDAIRMSSGGLTRFHSRTPPGISVRDYLLRLARHATLTPPLLLSMVYYIDRLCLMYSEFTINTLTVHRFLITAATVASKGLSDSFWNNATYARVGGVRLAELNLLELEFLHRVDWKIVPSPEDLTAYYHGLVERAPGYEVDSDEGSSDEYASDEDSAE